jgi:hypothetical protein
MTGRQPILTGPATRRFTNRSQRDDRLAIAFAPRNAHRVCAPNSNVGNMALGIQIE